MTDRCPLPIDTEDTDLTTWLPKRITSCLIYSSVPSHLNLVTLTHRHTHTITLLISPSTPLTPPRPTTFSLYYLPSSLRLHAQIFGPKVSFTDHRAGQNIALHAVANDRNSAVPSNIPHFCLLGSFSFIFPASSSNIK